MRRATQKQDRGEDEEAEKFKTQYNSIPALGTNSEFNSLDSDRLHRKWRRDASCRQGQLQAGERWAVLTITCGLCRMMTRPR